MSGDDVEEGGLRSEGAPVRLLTLNRPDRRNALDGDLHASMLSAVQAVAGRS